MTTQGLVSIILTALTKLLTSYGFSALHAVKA